jgi:hypothetical protein
MVVNHEGDDVILLPQQTKISKRTSKKLFLLFVICIVVGLLLSIPTTTPAQQSVTKEKWNRSGTEVDNLRRDLDDLRFEFEKVHRRIGIRNLNVKPFGFETKEEEFQHNILPLHYTTSSTWLEGEEHNGGINHPYPASFKGMTSKDYRAWKSEFEKVYRKRKEEREIQTKGYEEEKIAKDRLEAELQRVLKVELKAENKAKLKAYSEAEVDAKAQKKHYSETGEFISKGE